MCLHAGLRRTPQQVVTSDWCQHKQYNWIISFSLLLFYNEPSQMQPSSCGTERCQWALLWCWSILYSLIQIDEWTVALCCTPKHTKATFNGSHSFCFYFKVELFCDWVIAGHVLLTYHPVCVCACVSSFNLTMKCQRLEYKCDSKDKPVTVGKCYSIYMIYNDYCTYTVNTPHNSVDLGYNWTK